MVLGIVESCHFFFLYFQLPVKCKKKYMKIYCDQNIESLDFEEIFSVKGIGSLSFYAKINTRRDGKIYDLEEVDAL